MVKASSSAIFDDIKKNLLLIYDEFMKHLTGKIHVYFLIKVNLIQLFRIWKKTLKTQ